MSQPEQTTVAISLTVPDAGAALDFYTKAFGIVELFRMPLPTGEIAHAEFMLGSTHMYISPACEEWHAFPMSEGDKASCLLAISTDDCDASLKQAVDAGAILLNEPENQFWGVRTGMVLDPYGYRWSFRQFIEDVSPEEMDRRAKEIFGG